MDFPPKQFAPRPSDLQWKLLKLPLSGSAEGWVRAPLIGMDSHHGDWTQGCRRFLTGGALKCSYCERGSTPREIGYLPLLLRDQSRVVVQLSQTVCLKAMTLAVGDYVRVWRTKIMREAIRVAETPCPPANAGYAAMLAKVGPANVTRWLLKLWKDHELEKWYLKHRLTRVRVPCVDPPLPSQSEPVALSDVLQRLDHAPGNPPEPKPAPAPSAGSAAAWRAAKAGRNGHGH